MSSDKTKAQLLGELEGYRRRADELERILAERNREEAAYRKDVSRLAQAFQPTRIRVWRWAADTRLTQYLPSHEDVRGSRGEPVGAGALAEERLLQAHHPDDRDRVSSVWDRAYAEHTSYEVEYRIVDDDGGIRHQHEIATPEFDEAGLYLGHFGTTQDITQRKQAEDALREGRELLRTVLDAMPAIINVKDRDGRCVVANPAQAAFYGLTHDELIGKTVDDVVDPDYARLTRERDRQVLESGRSSLGFEDPGVDSEGNPTTWYTTKVPLTAPDGSVNGVLTVSVDISERKRTEEEVRTRDAWLRGILEYAPIEIVLKDTEGRIMALSRSTAEAFGVTVDHCLGRTTADFLPERLAETYMAADRKVLKTGRALQQEVVEEVDGTTRHSLNAKFPLRDDGGRIVGICSLTSDITEMKEMQARLFEAQKMEAVGQLTGGVAHDFNNLLAVIHGSAELLTDQVGSENPLAQSIMRAATRGAELTQRLLAYSRQQPLRPQSLDLAELVGGMSDLLARTLGATIEVRTVAEPDLWAATADAGQVENALLNLAINARDAMPRGGSLTVECLNTRLDEGYVAQNPEAVVGDYAVLAVSDTGGGMTAEVMEHAFEPFFTTKDVGEGSGLGLSMIYGFAKQSGGHVSIYSEEGKGTTVKLYLPRDAGVARPVDKVEGAEAPRGRGEVVLVIEDDAEVRAATVKTLEGLGYRVIDVVDAAAARTVLDRGDKLDLVLSDVVLPGDLSGPEFAEEVRERHPRLAVIFMSGYPAVAAARNGFLGSDRVLLNKPFRRHQLAEALSKALGR